VNAQVKADPKSCDLLDLDGPVLVRGQIRSPQISIGRVIPIPTPSSATPRPSLATPRPGSCFLRNSQCGARHSAALFDGARRLASAAVTIV